jgi:hypothetical protein
MLRVQNAAAVENWTGDARDIIPLLDELRHICRPRP